MAPESQDVIGLVRELQMMRAYGIEHVQDDNRISARDVPEVEWNYWHRLERDFPLIAQSLLDREEKLRIAVEALEKIQKRVQIDESQIKIRDGGPIWQTLIICQSTLSRIRPPRP